MRKQFIRCTIIAVLAGIALGGCSPGKKGQAAKNKGVESKVQSEVPTKLENPYSAELAYHCQEVEMYEVRIKEQKKRAKRALAERRMGDYRSATNQKLKYQSKIQYHLGVIQGLSGSDQ